MMVFKILAMTGGLLPTLAFAHIHTVQMKTDQILSVKTALGIATIIEAPQSIQSAIIGDQSGFKIEYIDKAVTIKPLRASARTNLYLQTSSRRYDLRLETSRQELADYVIYLRETTAARPVLWRGCAYATAGKAFSLKCLRLAHLPDGFLLDLRLTSKDGQKIAPENIWLRQGKDSKVINGIFLSKLEISKDHPVMLGMTLMKADLARDRAVQIEVEGKSETLRLAIPSEALWK